MKKSIFNGQTGETTIVDMTAEEITELNTKREQIASEEAILETAKQADATNKASGNQKLLDLGLSQAEATALTGYTPPVAE